MITVLSPCNLNIAYIITQTQQRLFGCYSSEGSTDSFLAKGINPEVLLMLDRSFIWDDTKKSIRLGTSTINAQDRSLA